VANRGTPARHLAYWHSRVMGLVADPPVNPQEMDPSPMPAAPETVRPLQTHLELAALPSAVSCARGHVRSVAHEWGLANLADTAALLASEIVTNAVQASGRLRTAVLPVVKLSITSDGESLVIRVWDAGQAMPVRQNVGPGDDSGRGLMIIDALSAGWGSYPEADGKVVWATISLADNS
jgi:anti-sigma regulatory factor (Ser/Thr protein kinase)